MQRRFICTILLLFSASCRHILYTRNLMHSGSNDPLPKFKLPGEINLLGEDAFSTDEDGVIVCDGVGGYAFTAYFAAKLFSLAAKHYYIQQRAVRTHKRQTEEIQEEEPRTNESIVAASAVSLLTGLEYEFKIHIVAINFLLREYLHIRSTSNQRPVNNDDLVKSFSDIIRFGIPEKYSGPDFPLAFEAKDAVEVLQAGTTITSASLLPVPENADPILLFYKRGDSLTALFRPAIDSNNKLVLQPVFSNHEFSPIFNAPDHLGLDSLQTFPNEDGETKNIIIETTKRADIDIVPALVHDVVFAGSDGIWDNLPLGVLTLIAGKVFGAFVAHDREGDLEGLRRALIAVVEDTLVEFLSATDDREFIERSMGLLKELPHLQRKPPQSTEDDEVFFQNNREFEFTGNALINCTPAEIFYVRYTNDPADQRSY